MAIKPFKLSQLSGQYRMTSKNLSKDDLFLVSDAANNSNAAKYQSKSIEYGELSSAMKIHVSFAIKPEITKQISDKFEDLSANQMPAIISSAVNSQISSDATVAVLSGRLSNEFITHTSAESIIDAKIESKLTGYIKQENFNTDNISAGSGVWILSGGSADGVQEPEVNI